MRLNGRIALVTGAGRGIGAAIAQRLIAEGAVVFAADLDPIDRGGRPTEPAFRLLPLDVGKPEDWREAAQLIGREHGRLDVLVNNAGINDRRGVLSSDFTAFEAMIRANLYGAYHGMRALVPLMPAGSSIVNIASLAGTEAHQFALYATSKWALRGLSKCAALELAPKGIRVNAVCPGLVVTDINRDQAYIADLAAATPLGPASTEDIAATVVWLACEESHKITGQDIIVDGGLAIVNGHNAATRAWELAAPKQRTSD